MAVSLLFFTNVAHSAPASEQTASIITPFPFAEDAAPQNVLDEMNIDLDLPKMAFDYFRKAKAYKSLSLVKEGAEIESDIYIKGEILHVSGGNGAARYWGGIAGAGRSELVVGIKVYDKSGVLINKGVSTQSGSRGRTIFSAFSNKKNITTAMKAIPSKLFMAVLVGDMTTPEGIVQAIETNYPMAIQAAAKASSRNELFLDEVVTDSLEAVLLKALKGDIKNKYFIDGASWCAINLGKSTNKKYLATLEKVASSRAHKKIKKHAKLAVIALNG